MDILMLRIQNSFRFYEKAVPQFRNDMLLKFFPIPASSGLSSLKERTMKKKLVSALLLSLAFVLGSCGNSSEIAVVSSDISSEISSEAASSRSSKNYMPGERPIDLFFQSLSPANATIEKDDGGVVYYYGEASIELYPDGKQEGYITNGDAGIYDFTFDGNKNVVLGQYYSDGSYLADGIHVGALAGFSGDVRTFSSDGSDGDFRVGLNTMLASYLYRFGDWKGLDFTSLTSVKMYLDSDVGTLKVDYTYLDTYKQRYVSHWYVIKDVGTTENASVSAFLKNPSGALARTDFSEDFLKAEDYFFQDGRGSIPFPADATSKFRDDAERNNAISDDPLALGFIDLGGKDYRKEYSEQLTADGFSFVKDEDGNDIEYSKESVWILTKKAYPQSGYIQERNCSVLMMYDDDIGQMYVGFTFKNEDLQSYSVGLPNELLSAWNEAHPNEKTHFFNLPSSDDLYATLIQGNLLREHYAFIQIAFDSLEGARAYYDTFAEAAENASFKKGTDTIKTDTEGTKADDGTITYSDSGSLFFYGPDDKTINLFGLFQDAYGHSIIVLSYDVGSIYYTTLLSEGIIP